MVDREPTADELNDIKQKIIHWPTNSQKMIDFLFVVKSGYIPGYSIINKFGASTVTTTLSPISTSNTYQTPTTEQEVEIVSDDVNDTIAGTGARKVLVQGLGSDWLETEEEVDMAGLTPVVLTTLFTRIFRIKVTESGSYATQTTGSHVGNITVQTSGGGVIWGKIVNTPIPHGQSEIGVYTIPKGKTGYLIEKHIFIDTTKTADLYMYYREGCDVVVVPFTPMRLIEREVGLQGGIDINIVAGKGPYVGPCDIGFMGVISNGTADSSVEFTLILVDD